MDRGITLVWYRIPRHWTDVSEGSSTGMTIPVTPKGRTGESVSRGPRGSGPGGNYVIHALPLHFHGVLLCTVKPFTLGVVIVIFDVSNGDIRDGDVWIVEWSGRANGHRARVSSRRPWMLLSVDDCQPNEGAALMQSSVHRQTVSSRTSAITVSSYWVIPISTVFRRS